MRGRTCILVTHNVALCVPQSQFVVVLDNGRVELQGTADEVMASGKLGEEVNRSRPGSASISRIPSRVPSSVGDESGATLVDDADRINGDSNGKAAAAANAAKRKSIDQGVKKDAMSEAKAEGGVKWTVLVLYLKSMGPWYVSLLIVSFASH